MEDMQSDQGAEKALLKVEIAELKSKVAKVSHELGWTQGLLAESNKKLSAVLQIKDQIEGLAPTKIEVRQTTHSESTAVMVASDWHTEERVDSKTVNGINEYNLEIGSERVEKFFQNGLSLIEMCRSRSRIDTLVLGLLGDMITGYIHPELAESNLLSPVEAIARCVMMIKGGIDFLLREGNLTKIEIPCCVGNHGRTTDKSRVSTAVKNSYEWLLYWFLSMSYQNEPRVKFSIADGYFVFADIYSTKFRFHHGDDVKYQGGVGGLTIPLNKAIAQWNKMRRVDVDVLGHWHTRINTRDAVVNGSLIGYSAYSIFIKASYEPPSQAFFLVHPEYGKTVEIPIMVGERGADVSGMA